MPFYILLEYDMKIIDQKEKKGLAKKKLKKTKEQLIFDDD